MWVWLQWDQQGGCQRGPRVALWGCLEASREGKGSGGPWHVCLDTGLMGTGWPCPVSHGGTEGTVAGPRPASSGQAPRGCWPHSASP